MHRRDRPSRGERENPVTGLVGHLTRLGDEMLVEVNVAGEARPLSFPVSEHVARRNGLGLGADVGVSLLAETLHLMPPDDVRDE